MAENIDFSRLTGAYAPAKFEEFKEKILELAEKGKIRALVVDEAHLLISWGDRFRSDYQLLPVFRRQLMERAPRGKELKTILLSATLNETDTDTLRSLFENKPNGELFTELRADELREEFTYQFHRCSSKSNRIETVKELIRQVPRPVIIYVQKPKQAMELCQEIRADGFQRVGCFHGDTSGSEKKDLLLQWNNDGLDIMVATSAFGMGVDKKDIRTVITCYRPLNLGNYYQEAGRAGRDAYSALNYWLYCPSIDDDDAQNIQQKVLTTEKFIEYLKKVQEDEQVDKEKDCYTFELSSTNLGIHGWEMYFFLALARSGYIDILDAQSNSQRSNKVSLYYKWKRVFLEANLFEEIDAFLEPQRKAVSDGMESIYKLFADFTQANDYKDAQGVVREALEKEYPECDSAVRLIRSVPFVHPNVKSNTSLADCMEDGFQPCMRSSEKDFCLIGDYTLDELLPILITNQVNVIVREKWSREEQESVIKLLADYDQSNYMLLSFDECQQILNERTSWFSGRCAVIYSDDIHGSYRLAKKISENGQTIHLVSEDIVLEDEGGRYLSDMAEKILI